MTSRYRTAFACAFIVIGLPLVAQEPGRVVDPEAYALYEQLLVPIWKDLIWPHGMPLLLQRETVELEGCELPKSVPEDWRPVVASFLQANRERKWLQPTRMGERLAGGNVAIALLANAIATGAALVALILTFGRRRQSALTPRHCGLCNVLAIQSVYPV